MIDAIQLLRGLTRLKNKKLLLGVTGSIACYKSAELLRHLVACGVHVSVTPTAGAKRFVTPLLFESLGAARVYPELFSSEDTFAHLEPGELCGGAFVCPASAGILSRMASGDPRDMLSAQLLAFSGPVAVAPAMNPRMWTHPATRANVATLAKRGVTIVEPDEGKVACGSEGQGRLAETPALLAQALRLVTDQDLAGQRVLLTVGPTREPWDGVRFWSNPSTGAMGAALALCAWLRGATVEAVAGPGVDSSILPSLPGLSIHRVSTAKEMYAQARAVWGRATMGMFTAAVADFSPMPWGKGKFKKALSPEGFTVSFEPNPDILRELSKVRKPGQKLLGFAAETAPDDKTLMELARVKLESKDVDVLAANRVNGEGTGFGTPTNAMAVAARSGREEIWPLQSKADTAWELCTWLSRA